MNKKDNNKKIKQIVLKVSPDIHAYIKGHVTYRYMSMKEYILSAVLEKIKQDKKYYKEGEDDSNRS